MFQCCMFVGFLWNKMVWSKTRYVRLLLSHSVTHPDICTVSRETVKTWVVCTPDHAVRLRASARGSCSVCDLRNVTFSELWSDVQPSCSCLQYMLNIWRISWEIWKYVHVSQTEHRNHSLTVVEAAFRDFTQVRKSRYSGTECRFSHFRMTYFHSSVHMTTLSCMYYSYAEYINSHTL